MAEISPDTDDIKITKLSPEHASAVAELHISHIRTGFISSLGVEFVTALYEAIAESPYGYGFVAVRDGEVVGFAAFAIHLSGLYKSVISKRGFRFLFSLSRKMMSFENIWKALETLFYPARVRNLPAAEFLSMVISKEERRKGLAAELIKRGFAETARRGVEELKGLVGADNKLCNTLLLKCGFELVGQINNHRVLSNIYLTRTDRFRRPSIFKKYSFQTSNAEMINTAM